jgi:hypothetical protein
MGWSSSSTFGLELRVVQLRARLLHPALPMTHLCYRCTAPATVTDGADARQRVPLVSN